MGTYVTITADADGKTDEEVRSAVDAAFGEVTRVDVLMSTYKPESQLNEINAHAGISPVKADPEVIENVKDAVYVAAVTGGAFDPTVGPLVKLWKIGSENARLPSPGEIERAKALVDYRQIKIDEEQGTIFIAKKGGSIDLGGIAKGYASDRAVESLKKSGIKGGIVACAGDLKVFGLRPDGRPWRVGIRHPRDKEALLAKVDLTDAATSTSGDYERYFIKDGVRYHHIIDPSTGYPARGLISVTVIAKESWRADAMCKLFVMGPEKGYKLALEHPEIEVLMVTSEGKILATGRFKDMKIGPVKVTGP
ncbi:MAG: FAD:protein FMN transferase [Nitrospirota bacterium]